MKVQGSCHCGRIRYEAEIDPATVTLCHCTDCQVMTGTAFRTSVQAPAAGFRWLGTNRPSVYLKTAQSGNTRRNLFCPGCGSPIAATADSDEPPSYNLRVGGLAQRADLPPSSSKWRRSALPWGQDVSGVPGLETQ
jgi:hypothetical protein